MHNVCFIIYHFLNIYFIFQGVLPWEYLNASNLEYINYALLNNLKQLTYQVKANRRMNCEDNEFADWREIELDNKIYNLDKDFEIQDANEKLKGIVSTIKLAKKFLLYFRQYQRTRFLLYLSMIWLGWIICLFFKITGIHRPVINSFILLIIDVAFLILAITLFIMHKGRIFIYPIYYYICVQYNYSKNY